MKILCDPSAATWKMLCPEHVMPPAAGHLGRVQVVSAAAVRETQAAFLTGREACDFATAGTVAIPRADMPFTAGLSPVTGPERIAETGPDRGFVTGNPVSVTAGPTVAVTLAEAVDAELLPMSLAAVRQARHRDDSFPAVAGMRGAAHLYSIDDLCAWQAGKEKVTR